MHMFISIIYERTHTYRILLGVHSKDRLASTRVPSKLLQSRISSKIGKNTSPTIPNHTPNLLAFEKTTLRA